MTTNPNSDNEKWLKLGELIDEARENYRKNEYDNAIVIFKKILSYNELDYRDRSTVLFELGRTYYDISEFKLALGVLKVIPEINEDFEYINLVFRLLGTCFFSLNSYDKSLIYRKKALVLTKEKKDKLNLYFEIGCSYEYLGNYLEAKIWFLKYLKGEKREQFRLKALYELGFCFYYLEDYKNATKNFEYLIRTGSNEHKVNGYYGLARFYYKTDQSKKLKKVVNNILEIDEYFSERETVLFYRILVFAEEGNVELASKYLGEFLEEFPDSEYIKEIKDSL